MTTTTRRLSRPLLAALLITAPAVAAETLRLDADTAARLALEASARVTAANARRAGAESAVAAADAARLPTVTTAALLSQRSAVPEFSAPLDGPGAPPRVIFPNIETAYDANLALTQPLYAGGAIGAGRAAARHDLEAAVRARDLTTSELRYAARAGYWQAAAAEAALHAAEAQEVRAGRLHEDAQALRTAGMAVDADLLGAAARAAAARVDVVQAAADRDDALAALRSLLGLDPGTTLELGDAGATALPPPPAPLSALVRQALEDRPDLRLADARIASLAARERAVDAGRRPTVGLQALWDLSRPNQRYLPLADAWNDSWSVGLTAAWTVFDGDRVRSSTAAVRAGREAAAADRDELARRARLAVESARLRLQAAFDAVPAADAARAAAESREQASRERYAAGLAPIQEILDAQADLADAELARIRSRATAWIAAATLDRAVGR